MHRSSLSHSPEKKCSTRFSRGSPHSMEAFFGSLPVLLLVLLLTTHISQLTPHVLLLLLLQRHHRLDDTTPALEQSWARCPCRTFVRSCATFAPCKLAVFHAEVQPKSCCACQRPGHARREQGRCDFKPSSRRCRHSEVSEQNLRLESRTQHTHTHSSCIACDANCAASCTARLHASRSVLRRFQTSKA